MNIRSRPLGKSTPFFFFHPSHLLVIFYSSFYRLLPIPILLFVLFLFLLLPLLLLLPLSLLVVFEKFDPDIENTYHAILRIGTKQWRFRAPLTFLHATTALGSNP